MSSALAKVFILTRQKTRAIDLGWRPRLPGTAEQPAEVADGVTLAPIGVARGVWQHVEALFVEPTVITTGMLAAVLDTHVGGTGLAEKLHDRANMGTHRKSIFRLSRV
jgi:hypothetical protein